MNTKVFITLFVIVLALTIQRMLSKDPKNIRRRQAYARKRQIDRNKKTFDVEWERRRSNSIKSQKSRDKRDVTSHNQS